MTTILWGSFALLGFFLLIWYLETCYEVYQNWKHTKQNEQDRANARYIQKVDRYYHDL